MQVLYRKYRPKSFESVIGQEIVKKIITKQIADKKVGHAYLFTGPRGIGKTTVARLLAKALNCTNMKEGEFEPCNKCSNCIDANEGKAVDIIEIDAASNNGVDNVREHIIDSSRYMPSQGKRKVFIIDEVHMLSTQAFNALLKTLEEPPEHVNFILATTEEHKIPATILSRCQRMPFTTVPPDLMRGELENIAKKENAEIESGVYDMIIRASEGCMRDAESLLGQLFLEGEKITVSEASLVLPFAPEEEVQDLIMATLEGNSELVISRLKIMVERGLSMSNVHNQLIDFARNLLFENIHNEKTAGKIQATPKDIYKLLEKLISTKSYSEHSMIPQIKIEIALLDCILGLDRSVEKIDEKKVTDAVPEAPNLAPKPEDDSIEEKEDIANEPQEIEERTGELTLEEVQGKWKRCIKELGKKSMGLTLALGSATPVSLEGNKIGIEFSSKFHFEAMNSSKSVDLLRDAIGKVLLIPVDLELFSTAEDKGSTNIDKLADAFGGAVIG